jgi:hypothetical protein
MYLFLLMEEGVPVPAEQAIYYVCDLSKVLGFPTLSRNNQKRLHGPSYFLF